MIISSIHQIMDDSPWNWKSDFKTTSTHTQLKYLTVRGETLWRSINWTTLPESNKMTRKRIFHGSNFSRKFKRLRGVNFLSSFPLVVVSRRRKSRRRTDRFLSLDLSVEYKYSKNTQHRNFCHLKASSCQWCFFQKPALPYLTKLIIWTLELYFLCLS